MSTSNIKTLQLLRNTTVASDLKTAATGLIAALKNKVNGKTLPVAIGTPALGLYNDGTETKALLGVCTGTDKYQIFEGVSVDESTGKLSVPQTVLDAITSTIGDKSVADQIKDAINDLNSEINAAAGKFLTGVKIVDGKLDATVAEAGLTSTNKTITVNGYNLEANIDGETIIKDANGVMSVASSALTQYVGKEAVAVSAADAEKNEKTISLAIAGTDKVLTQSDNGLIANLSLDYNSTEKKIILKGKDGAEIDSFSAADFVVDGMLESVAYEKDGEAEGNVLVFTWNTDGKKTATKIDLAKYIDTYTAGNGIDIIEHSISAKIKDGDKYLEVTTDGIASKGIDGAISSAIADLDAEKTSEDGTYVTVKVTEVDGKITAVNVIENDIAQKSLLDAEVTRAEAAEKVNADAINTVEASIGLNEDGSHKTTTGVYTKNATTIAGEIAALDAAVDGMAKAAAALNATEGEAEVADGNHVAVQVKQVAGKITEVKVSENDIASAAALATEEGRADAAEKALGKRIDDLDLEQVGDGTTYVKFVSQTDGQLAAEAATLNAAAVTTTPVTGDNTKVAVAGDNVKEQIDTIATILKSAANTSADLTTAVGKNTEGVAANKTSIEALQKDVKDLQDIVTIDCGEY